MQYKKYTFSISDEIMGILKHAKKHDSWNQFFLKMVAEYTKDAPVCISEGGINDNTRYTLLVRGSICCVCGVSMKDAKMEIDHIYPRSRGGTDDIDNLRVLCHGCNQKKRDKILDT